MRACLNLSRDLAGWQHAHFIYQGPHLSAVRMIISTQSMGCWRWMASWFVWHHFWTGVRLKLLSHFRWSGYALRPWLMTPISNPATPQDMNMIRPRCTIWLLKGRWVCLAGSGGTLQYRPENVCCIMACCAFYNLAIRQGVPLQSPRTRFLDTWSRAPICTATQTRYRF